MKDFFNIIKCVFVIIGVIVGAGFASGKEIYTFFYTHGKYGFFGLIISIFLIGYAIFKTLKIIKKYDINNYDEFLDVVLGNYKIKKLNINKIKNNNLISKKCNEKSNIKIIINFIINTFLIISFFVMCAGFSAYFQQEFGIKIIFASIFLAIFSYIILNKNINGIFILNLILIPIIIFVLIFLNKFSITKNYFYENTEINFFWIISSVLYASYNSITLISMLIPMKKYIKSKKGIFIISLMCIIIIFILALIIYNLFFITNENLSKIDLPIIYVISQFGNKYRYLYGIILISAIVTTALSSAYGFLNNISKTRKKYKKYNLLICIISIFISHIGFATLVNSLYPLFGVLGLIQLIFILKCK